MVAAGWLAGLDSAVEWLAFVRDTRLAVQFGGAAGTLASLGDAGARVKALMAEELGLADPPLPWHTERLRIIDVGAASARACAALSKIARDVTLLAQTEVGEVAEGGGRRARRAPAAPRPRRLVRDAEQEQPGRRGRHPRLREAGPRPAGHPARQRRAGVPARGRAPGTPSGSRTATCSSSPSRPPPGRVTCWRTWTSTRRGWPPTWREAGGLPLAERVTALLRGSLGAPAAHDLVAVAAARSASSGVPFRDVLLATPEIEDKMAQAGITPAQVERALDPSGYLGASDAFISAALAAHAAAPGS